MRDTTTDSAPQNFSDDAPKTNPWKEDRLGFAPFARRLSTIIQKLQAPNGYVIGLHGIWGSGKTTALHFVEAYLRKGQDEGTAAKITVVHFRPWIISGHQDLVSAFFKVLKEALDPVREQRKGWCQKAFEKTKTAASPLLSSVSAVGALTAGPAGVVASTAANLAKVPFDKLMDAWMAEPSLQGEHEKLQAELAKRQDRILVIIDDIDRLRHDEIRAVMQMVKSVGQLPNVIYLLAYDRGVVWPALDEGAPDGDERPGFAEKIVQQELELPVPRRDALLSLFDEQASFLLSAISEDGDLRWFHLINHGLRRWLKNPRDVLRFANALRFCAPALMNDMDPHDILAMEGLRMFDRSAFEWIRRNRDYLFSEGKFHMADKLERAAQAALLSEAISSADRNDVITLVADLFPHISEHLNPQHTSYGSSYADTVRRRGVGTAFGYDAYFGLLPSPDAVPKPMLDEFVQRLNDESWLTATLHQFVREKDSKGYPLIDEFLTELLMRLQGHRSITPTQALLNALLAVGAEIFPIDARRRTLSFPPRQAWSYLISEILRRWPFDEAGDHLLAALPHSNSSAVWAELFVERGRELGLLVNHSRQLAPSISEASFQEFGQQLLALITEAAAAGTLGREPFYFDILIGWEYLAGADTPKHWVETVALASAASLVKLSKGLLSYSIQANRRDFFMNEAPDAALIDLNLLHEAAQRHATDPAIQGEDVDRINALITGSEQHLKSAVSGAAGSNVN